MNGTDNRGDFSKWARNLLTRNSCKMQQKQSGLSAESRENSFSVSENTITTFLTELGTSTPTPSIAPPLVIDNGKRNLRKSPKNSCDAKNPQKSPKSVLRWTEGQINKNCIPDCSWGGGQFPKISIFTWHFNSSYPSPPLYVPLNVFDSTERIQFLLGLSKTPFNMYIIAWSWELTPPSHLLLSRGG